jgi:ribosomal protein S12 methylthiotransferase accessory factor
LNGLAIFPNSVQLFSDQQKVPFDPSKVMDWLPVKSSTGKLRFLPKDVALPGCFDLNGVGCGRTTKDAVRHGLLELVERDALAIWWYNRLRRPAVDWRSAQDDYLIRVDTFLRKRGSSFWILDITADLEIPVVVAISSFPLCMGFSAHPNALIAIRNAVAELVQMCLLRDHASELWREPSLIDWWRDIEVENATYLQPNGLVPIATASSGELDSRLQAMGFEIFVLDCTQPQFDRSVVRVFVPGLRPPQPRFADGRLYDVPIQLGDRSEPIREEEMNQPLFPEYLNA